MSAPTNPLTEIEIQTVLKEYLKSGDVSLKSHKIEPFSNTLDGCVGQHYLLTIEYNHKTETSEPQSTESTMNFFVKVLNSTTRINAELCDSINAFGKEQCFYNLQKEYKQLGIDTSFSPDSLFIKPNVFVLENLNRRGFRMVPKKGMFDLAHVKKSLDALAKFHASSLIYEEIKSKELGKDFRLSDLYAVEMEEKIYAGNDNKGAEWLRCSVEGIIDMVDLISPPNSSLFKEKIKKAYTQLPQIIKPYSEHRNVTLHGDLWTNNFVFNYENGVPQDCILLDYQLLKYGPPSIDVMQMIIIDTWKPLRDEHLKKLLDFYYESFSKNLAKHGLVAEELVPKVDFLKLCDLVQVPVRLHAISGRAMTFLADKCFLDAMTSDEAFESFLYKDRSSSMKYSYLTNSRYREVVTEDMMELYEKLLPK